MATFYTSKRLMIQENNKKAPLITPPGVKSLINRMSRRYLYSGFGIDDLIQEAWLAVFQEQDKWSKMEPGVQQAYLMPFIKRAMLDYSLANNRIVKIITTKKQRKALSNIRSYIEVGQYLSHKLEEQIASDLEVTVRDVRVAYGFLFNSDDCCSADANTYNTPKQLTISEESTLAELGSFSQEQSKLEALYQAMDNLSDRQVEVVNSRWLEDTKKTRKVISKELGVTPRGVRFIESEALRKLRENITQNLNVNCH